VRSILSRAGRFERAVARRADADGILEHPRHVRLVHQAGGQCSMLPDSNIARSLPSVAGTLTTSMPVAFETTILHYIDLTNERPKPFVWTKTADEILASVARFCQRISNSGH
jgi:hypothetical protein